MKRPAFQRGAVSALLLLMFAATAHPQGQPTPAAPAQRPMTSLRVQVVIARYEGDKKISSLPYTLAVTANAQPGVTLRMGSQVPVPGGGGAFQYMNVGTNIDCSAVSADDGRFKLDVRIEDSSIMERRPEGVAGAIGVPTLRNFMTSNAVVLRDGQSTQFTLAADKVTGEVVRVDISLAVER